MTLYAALVLTQQPLTNEFVLSPFWSTVDRIVMQLVFVIALIYIIIRVVQSSKNTGTLLKIAQEDREAREQTLIDLKKSAEALALRTEAALKDRDDQLSEIHDEVKETKSLAETNKQLVDMTTQRMSTDHQLLHAHIDQAVEAVEAATETATKKDIKKNKDK